MTDERAKKLARRKELQRKVAVEQARNAGVAPSSDVPAVEQPIVIYSKHFFIEPQGDEDGEDVYAVYRTTDLLSSPGDDSPQPIHVYDLITDALRAMVVLDQLVDKTEPESPFFEAKDDGAEPVEVVGTVTQ